MSLSNPGRGKTLRRVMRVLTWVQAQEGQFTQTELAAAVGIERKTAYHYLIDLETEGLIRASQCPNDGRLRLYERKVQ